MLIDLSGFRAPMDEIDVDSSGLVEEMGMGEEPVSRAISDGVIPAIVGVGVGIAEGGKTTEEVEVGEELKTGEFPFILPAK